MNNVVQFNPTAAPAFVRNRAGADDLTTALAGGVGFGKRISIRGNMFRLISGGQEVAVIEDRYLDVVIVKAMPRVSRMYYEGKYDKNADNAAPPTCWASDGVKPDDDVPNPVSPNCASCPNNVAGSGENDMRACRYQQRLAVVLADEIDKSVMQLALPAQSIFGKEDNGNHPLQSYAKWLAAQNIRANEVVTRMKFDPKSESPKLFFKTVRWLEQDEYQKVVAHGESQEAEMAVKLHVRNMDGGKNPKPAALTGPGERNEPFEQEQPAAEAAQEVKRGRGRPPGSTKKVAEPEAVAEPVVRRAEAPEPVVKPSMSKLAADWGVDD